MTDNNAARTLTSRLQFPPLPLASGDVFVDTEGNVHAVEGVSAVIHLSSGERVAVALEHRFGGWWIPAQK